jgi:hypothetical protein
MRNKNGSEAYNALAGQRGKSHRLQPVAFFLSTMVTVDERFDGDHGFTLAPFTAQGE